MGLVILIGVLVAATLAALWRGGIALPVAGAAEGARLFASVLPQLVVGFLLAGMVTVLLPADLIGRWLGHDSGVAGVLIATAAGALTPGGPYLQFPLVASLANAGAGPGPMAAYLGAWSLVSLNRLLVWEIPLLGAQFALVRWAVSLLLPVLAGLLVPVVLRFVTRSA